MKYLNTRIGVRSLVIVASMLLVTAVQAQITDAPSIKLGPPSADTFMGKKPANLRAPATDPRDLNGMYVPDLASQFGRGAPGAAPGSNTARPPSGPPPNNSAGAPPGGGEPANDSAYMQCLPNAQIATHDYGEQVLQTPGRVTFIMEYNHVIRRIYLDAKFPDKIEPSYGGYSIGHWEGDTLVIETRGLKSNKIANSPTMLAVTQVVERVRKIEGGMVLEDKATIEGVDRAGKPMSTNASARLAWRPDLHLQEFICEDGADLFFAK